MKLNLEEIENLVQVRFCDWGDYGHSDLEIERAIAEQRARIGYTKKHLELFREKHK